MRDVTGQESPELIYGQTVLTALFPTNHQQYWCNKACRSPLCFCNFTHLEVVLHLLRVSLRLLRVLLSRTWVALANWSKQILAEFGSPNWSPDN